jgi:hypothetical protein
MENFKLTRNNVIKKSGEDMKKTVSGIMLTLVLFGLLPSNLLVEQSEWLSIEDERFIIYYREGYKSDAEMILGYCQFARNVTMEAYPHQLEVKVKVYLYDYGSWKDSPWVTRADSLKAEMYFLTPSDVPEQYRQYIDNLWYQKNVVHEYVHIPTWRDVGGYGSVKNPPSWLMEGIAEYIAVFRTSEEILQKYNWSLKEIENIVKKGDGYPLIVSGNIYYGGAYMLKYMYETYGKDKVVAVFKNEANSFMEALENALEVTYWEFEDKWLEWASNEFGADPNIYVKFESYEGKKLYEEVLVKYNELNATYNGLKAKYDKLLAFPDLNSDGKINIIDIASVARQFGKELKDP